MTYNFVVFSLLPPPNEIRTIYPPSSFLFPMICSSTSLAGLAVSAHIKRLAASAHTTPTLHVCPLVDAQQKGRKHVRCYVVILYVCSIFAIWADCQDRLRDSGHWATS